VPEQQKSGRRAVAGLLVSGLLMSGCGTNNANFAADVVDSTTPSETPITIETSPTVRSAPALRVYHNPYEKVDWTNDLRLTAQHHDHIALRNHYIAAYDAAGYDVVSLMDYSGNTELTWALRQRVWPANQWVPQYIVASLKNIKLFVPNAEEVGVELRMPWDPIIHATSPFLTTWIEGAPKTPVGAAELPLLPNQYRTLEQLFALVGANGGFPCLAHPWNYSYTDINLGSAYCVEIYNALADASKEQGARWYTEKDRNETILAAWDQALIRNQRVLGIAVNDHFGPYTPAGVVSNKVRDSGKIVVFAKAVTLPAYREAFEAGSFFAVRDYGEIKHQYPKVYSIAADDGYLYAETAETVTWIADGRVVGNQPMLRFKNLSYGVRYVRAEISDAVGSTVYTQAFTVRPLGDVDGDYDVDFDDEALCPPDSSPSSDAARRACAALTRHRAF
jgi:hypothetical protein